MKSSKFFIQIILLIFVSISCTKRDEVEINYNELSSLVSSEAKTINFFKKNLQLNSDRFPIVKIEENTFLDQTIVETEGTIFPKTNLPENWGLINETNYGWSFFTSNEPLKDLEINIFYGIPNEKMLLTGWEDKFTLYAKHKDSTSFDTWRKAEAIPNKGERKFTITENM